MTLRYPSHKRSYMERFVAELPTALAGNATLFLADRVLVRGDFSGTGHIAVEAGSEDGQIRIIIAETATGTNEINDTQGNLNTVLHTGKWKPIAGSVLSIMWNVTLNKWVELYRNNI